MSPRLQTHDLSPKPQTACLNPKLQPTAECRTPPGLRYSRPRSGRGSNCLTSSNLAASSGSQVGLLLPAFYCRPAGLLPPTTGYCLLTACLPVLLRGGRAPPVPSCSVCYSHCCHTASSVPPLPQRPQCHHFYCYRSPHACYRSSLPVPQPDILTLPGFHSHEYITAVNCFNCLACPQIACRPSTAAAPLN